MSAEQTEFDRITEKLRAWAKVLSERLTILRPMIKKAGPIAILLLTKEAAHLAFELSESKTDFLSACLVAADSVFGADPTPTPVQTPGAETAEEEKEASPAADSVESNPQSEVAEAEKAGEAEGTVLTGGEIETPS